MREEDFSVTIAEVRLCAVYLSRLFSDSPKMSLCSSSQARLVYAVDIKEVNHAAASAAESCIELFVLLADGAIGAEVNMFVSIRVGTRAGRMRSTSPLSLMFLASKLIVGELLH